ncbi:branched-chain amino acid ABC transporter permease [Pseudooceanicola sediminis]|uniref:Branched-chain amino acid ABC transporter permease n=1 Tax=Pseudooceanicola sediminis TaxID=2211117 RepID=A0A399IXG7_9RHOB|nr:branched-chain amino acid ABC transporter permease [Pseudooceanicola sediminis]RII37878.1 branched-chain amino acid ABC transporter permease [Pseudooceanicola sediminis]|tara:strand:+ start:44073 stop:44990 length:918 start_codon:yes stop_codon:yes gene_type:complete
MLLVQQIVNGLMVGSVYVTVAVAFTLTISILNFLNFTIPTLFMVAGMVGWGLAYFGLPFGLSGPLAWPLALAVGGLASVLCSLLVERFTFRYMRTRHGDSTEHAIPLVSSLGFLLILENLIRIFYGSDSQRFPGPSSDLTAQIGGIFVRIPQLVSFAIVMLLILGLVWMMKSTRIGRGLRAIAENPDAASILGVEPNRIVPVVFMLTGLLCGLAGALFAVNYGEVSPQMGEDIGSKAIAGMVVGGLGSLWGAVAGGIIVGLVEMLTIHFFGADAVQVAVWGALLVTLLMRPQGLFGHNAIGKGKL